MVQITIASACLLSVAYLKAATREFSRNCNIGEYHKIYWSMAETKDFYSSYDAGYNPYELDSSRVFSPARED